MAILQSKEHVTPAGRIDAHFHTRERWLGAKAGWTGGDEDNEADETLTPFVLDAGNDTWSVASYCILGTADTPVITGEESFDLHRLLVTASEANVVYKIRIAWGTSYDAAVTVKDYSEVAFIPLNNKIDAGPVELKMPLVRAGTKVFASCWAAGENTATISFLIGLHEY